MSDTHKVPDGLKEAVLEAALMELGGESLDGSDFEAESPTNLDAELLEGDPQ